MIIDKIKQPEIKEGDSKEEKEKKEKKIVSNNEKVTKLQTHVKTEADKSNSQIMFLCEFKILIYFTIDLLYTNTGEQK